MQYRRIFTDDLLLNHKKLMNDYDLICQIPVQQYGIFADDGGYSNRYLERCIKLIAKNMPEYKEYIDILYKDSKMICHNMFIMHKINFIKYCEFLFCSLDMFAKEINIDIYKFSRIKELSIIAERISHLFFIKHFNPYKIYYTPILVLK